MALSAVSLAAALAVATNAISLSEPAEAIGYAVGSALVLLALPYILLLFGRTEAAWKTLIVMCVLVALAQWSNYTANEDPAGKRATLELAETGRVALKEQQRLLEKYRSEPSTAASEARPVATAPFEESTGATIAEGESTEAAMIKRMTVLIRDQSAKSIAMSEAMADATLNLKLEETLEPIELTTAAGIARSRARLSKYALLVDDSERLSAAFVSNMEREFRVITQGSKNQGTILSNFQASRQRRGEIDRLMMANQRSLIATATRIVNFMEVRVGDTSIKGDQILFPSEYDVKAYNDMLTELTELTDEETLLTNRLQAFIGENLKSAEQLAASAK